MTHDFDDDFNFSTTDDAHGLVRRACHRLLYGCCGVTRATPAQDRMGVDYWVMTGTGRYSLDLKLRRIDYGRKRGRPMDCVIELDSHGTSGWLMKQGGANLILFACADSYRVAMYETKVLRIAVVRNLSRWLATGVARLIEPRSTRDGREWTSAAVIVPSDMLDQAIEQIQDPLWPDAANDGAANEEA